MINSVKNFVKRTPLATPFIFVKGLTTEPVSQNEEEAILAGLIAGRDIPECFVELGFSGWEFNCASLAQKWEGLLIDGDPYNARIARTIFPKRVTARSLWLTLDSLEVIHSYAAGREIGVLSVDVDGNDYWFLENLIGLRPSIIIAEYNAVFGRRPITVPYDPQFDRRYRSEDWIYYGASLSALTHLAEANGYQLVAVASGINAFFMRSDLLGDAAALDADTAFVERRCWNSRLPSDHWPDIAHLPYVDVTVPGRDSRT